MAGNRNVTILRQFSLKMKELKRFSEFVLNELHQEYRKGSDRGKNIWKGQYSLRQSGITEKYLGRLTCYIECNKLLE